MNATAAASTINTDATASMSRTARYSAIATMSTVAARPLAVVCQFVGFGVVMRIPVDRGSFVSLRCDARRSFGDGDFDASIACAGGCGIGPGLVGGGVIVGPRFGADDVRVDARVFED